MKLDFTPAAVVPASLPMSQALSERNESTVTWTRLALVAILVAAPFPFGAVQVWAWTTLGVLVFGLFFVWTLVNARAPTVRLVWSPIYVPAVAFMLLGAVQLFSGHTADAPATREALLKMAANLMVFFLTLQLWSRALNHDPKSASSGSSPRILGLTITMYTAFLSLFAVLQFFSSRGLIYWNVQTTGWVFGPYVNHNHYAGLMEMLIPAVVMFSIAEHQRHAGVALPAFALLIAVASIFLSGSRSGCLIVLGELMVIAVIAGKRQTRHYRRRLAAVGLLGTFSAGALFFWLDTDGVGRHLVALSSLTQSPEATLGNRLTVAHDTLRIFRDNPWFGTGLGSFAVVYPQYESFPTDKAYDHAHNDFAEALAETGIVGGLLILFAFVLAFRQAQRKLGAYQTDRAGWLRFAAEIGCCGLLIHSFCDFNLHIPANAAWFAFLLGISQGGNA